MIESNIDDIFFWCHVCKSGIRPIQINDRFDCPDCGAIIGHMTEDDPWNKEIFSLKEQLKLAKEEIQRLKKNDIS